MNADRLAAALNRVRNTFWLSAEETEAVDTFFAIVRADCEACAASSPSTEERSRVLSSIYDEALVLRIARPHIACTARLRELAAGCSEQAARMVRELADAVDVYSEALRVAAEDSDWSAERFASTVPNWYVPTGPSRDQIIQRLRRREETQRFRRGAAPDGTA